LSSRRQDDPSASVVSMRLSNADVAYIRIYGPEQAAFDKSWKPGDFVEIKIK
jgi:hypothetical protein